MAPERSGHAPSRNLHASYGKRSWNTDTVVTCLRMRETCDPTLTPTPRSWVRRHLLADRPCQPVFDAILGVRPSGELDSRL